MKRLLSFFGSRGFLTFVGTAALALLVWFLGPLFAFAGRAPLAEPGVRAWTIGALFLIWALVRIGLALAERLRNRRLMEQLAAGPEPAPDPARQASNEELASLKERFEKAMEVLKRADGRRRLGGYWVYQLPWYLIIGPPGCGKTTALVNSGLRFPLARELGQDAIHGIGGTRNCDWWFTDEAVILDTAGRYTTQDSYQEVDKAAWGGFLALLKKYRPRRPVNGVLVAMSLADLLQQSPAERESHARAIRARVQEIYATFGVRCPIYAVFMKADLVAGFGEFFADLGQEGREQVWGMTFPFDPGTPQKTPAAEPGAGPLAGLDAEHRALVERLDQRLLGRMEQEREVARRALIFGFPSQFAALGETIRDFLDATFSPSRFEARPLVRGVYFTSGTQTGTPIDRVLSAIAANFGLGRQGPPPFAGTAKAYFVHRLFRDLIFSESGLAGLDPRAEQRRLWLRRGAYGAAAALTLLAGLAWTASYSRNRAYVAEVAAATADIDRRIESLKGEDQDPLAVLPLLDAARAIPGGYDSRDRGTPWSMGLGLYQGDKLGSQAAQSYRRLLHRTLLPRVILRMEEQIRRGSANPDFLYDALGIYLSLDDPAHYDPQAVWLWVSRDWDQTLPRGTTREQRAALDAHLNALLEQSPAPLPLALDGKTIEGARERLNVIPLTERIYRRLQREGVGGKLADFSPAAAGGDLAPLVLTRPSGKPLTQGIPALYTFAGYRQGFDLTLDRLLGSAAEESWVLGPQAQVKPGSAEAQVLIASVRQRYLQDYSDHWEGLLKDLGLVSARDLQHASEIARILADPKQSPMGLLLSAAADQTELDRPALPEGTAAGALDKAAPALGQGSGTLSVLRQRVGQYFGEGQPGTAAEGGAAQESPEAAVSRRFAWLRELVRGTPDKPAPIDGVQQQMAQLHSALGAIVAAESSGRSTLAAGEGKEIQEARQAAARLPQPVARMVGTLVQDSAALVAGGARARLNSIWTSQVLPFCREAIGGRYPFDKGSRKETTLADFGRLFGPTGLLDTFFNEHLAKVADTSRRTWRWASGVGIPDSVLVQLQRAASIREAFFLGGGKVPAVTFELTPVELDAGATQLILDIGGQLLDYRHGPIKSQIFQWPSPEGIPRARLVLVGTDGRESSQSEEGAWAWFRLLNKAKFQTTPEEERFRIRFAQGGHSAELELKAASVRNPFAFNELRGFSCPERL